MRSVHVIVKVAGILAAALLVVLISYTMLSLLFLSIPYKDDPKPNFPNGAYLNRAHPFSNEIVLRALDGRIVVRGIVHVLFNDRYVAGQFYVARITALSSIGWGTRKRCRTSGESTILSI